MTEKLPIPESFRDVCRDEFYRRMEHVMDPIPVFLPENLKAEYGLFNDFHEFRQYAIAGIALGYASDALSDRVGRLYEYEKKFSRPETNELYLDSSYAQYLTAIGDLDTAQALVFHMDEASQTHVLVKMATMLISQGKNRDAEEIADHISGAFAQKASYYEARFEQAAVRSDSTEITNILEEVEGAIDIYNESDTSILQYLTVAARKYRAIAAVTSHDDALALEELSSIPYTWMRQAVWQELYAIVLKRGDPDAADALFLRALDDLAPCVVSSDDVRLGGEFSSFGTIGVVDESNQLVTAENAFRLLTRWYRLCTPVRPDRGIALLGASSDLPVTIPSVLTLISPGSQQSYLHEFLTLLAEYDDPLFDTYYQQFMDKYPDQESSLICERCLRHARQDNTVIEQYAQQIPSYRERLILYHTLGLLLFKEQRIPLSHWSQFVALLRSQQDQMKAEGITDDFEIDTITPYLIHTPLNQKDEGLDWVNPDTLADESETYVPSSYYASDLAKKLLILAYKRGEWEVASDIMRSSQLDTYQFMEFLKYIAGNNDMQWDM